MDHAGNAEDVKLVNRCKAGEVAAFNALFARHSSWVLNLAYRLTGNADDAADMTQDAFVRAYRSIGRYDGRAAFTTWLYRVTVNVCLDELKRRGRRPVAITSLLDEDDPTPEPDDPAPDLHQELEARERRRVLLQAIYALPPKHRSVLVLYELEGLSYDQMAGALGTNVGTVKSRLNRARLALRRQLEPARELFLGSASHTEEAAERQPHHARERRP